MIEIDILSAILSDPDLFKFTVSAITVNRLISTVDKWLDIKKYRGRFEEMKLKLEHGLQDFVPASA
ncbi:hypothetical protein [Maridesulfovibrio sp.]|uniref:hypothetical protein n=1 Tax=Maridesulfovibrio sp. TaxID=2795000 RepID=UPI002AA7A59B|nr:hypothetical protein [Maridesulfovibrio sp.]